MHKFPTRDSLHPSSSDALYAVETIASEVAFHSLEAAWNRLSEASASPNVFASHGWFEAWSQQLLIDDGSEQIHPHVLVLKQGNTVTGVCPLLWHRHSRFGLPIRTLKFVTDHADYNDLILGEDPRANRFSDELSRADGNALGCM